MSPVHAPDADDRGEAGVRSNGRPVTAARAAFSAIALATAASAVLFTWLRLFVGMDLQSESFYILVPWRWALGDEPFVHEQSLVQIPGLATYPFVKAFGIVRDYDPTGLVLYTRHLYLLMMVGVAVAVFMLLRRLVRWQLALVVASASVTFVFFATPNLSYNTMAIAFLTLSATLGTWVVVEGRGWGFALASGAGFGVAVAVYPSLLAATPLFAGCFVLAGSARVALLIARVRISGPQAHLSRAPLRTTPWRAVGAWLLGVALVLVPLGLVMLSFGFSNLVRCWRFTVAAARPLNELGGAAKGVQVAGDTAAFFASRPYLVLAALVILLIYRRRPRLGRAILATLPVALWLAAQQPVLRASGYELAYALMTPYLYLFIPADKRVVGARLLIWVWAPAVVAGAVTAYTSASGYVNAPVGLAPAIVASGVFLAWALEAVAGPRTATGEPGVPWLALLTAVAVVVVTIVFQFQFQQVRVPYGELTSRLDSGPWWGIKVTPERHRLLDTFAADLRAQARPEDGLLVFYDACGYYLFWTGAIAANTYWIEGEPVTGWLDQTTIDYYHRHRVVPTLIVHLMPTHGLTPAQLRASSGGLDYAPSLVRPTYVFQRKGADETTSEVLARLRRT